MHQVAAVALLLAMMRVMQGVGCRAAVVFSLLDDLGLIVATRSQAGTARSEFPLLQRKLVVARYPVKRFCRLLFDRCLVTVEATQYSLSCRMLGNHERLIATLVAIDVTFHRCVADSAEAWLLVPDQTAGREGCHYDQYDTHRAKGEPRPAG